MYNGVEMPQLGFKYYEKFKILLHEGNVKKALKNGIRAREILEFFFKKSDNLQEMDELE